VYVAAQRRGLRAFSANPGVVSETIVLNTRSYSATSTFAFARTASLVERALHDLGDHEAAKGASAPH